MPQIQSRPSRRPSRAQPLRVALAAAVLATAVWLVVDRPVRLGLDLRGGTQIVLETHDSPSTKADADATERTLEVLRRRVDALGVAEPSLTRSGTNRIIVELPGVQDPEEAKRVIGRTAELTFHPVRGTADAAAATGRLVLPDETGQPLLLGPSALTGDAVSDAQPALDPQTGTWSVTVDFRGRGADAWERLTGDAACKPAGDPQRRVAIVLDNDVISSPQVALDVSCGVGIPGGSTSITGNFSADEAKDLALLIRAGALPVPVETVEQRTVGPTLGAQAIQASKEAAILGGLLTVAFLIAVYRLFGAVAAVALGVYGIVSYAALLALGATLTLPGIAGFVLAIGMAVDANVLVFERAREELAAHPARGVRAAVAAGFSKAWTAIADSNITTLLAAGLLFYLAAGPVRGFGVTLTVGVLVSMFTALVVTRALVHALVCRPGVRGRPRLLGIGDLGWVRRRLEQRNPDLMRRRRLWLALSGLAVAVALAGIGARGLTFGVEFTGGRLVEYTTTQPLAVDDARDAVTEAGLPRAVVQESGDGAIAVRDSGLTDDTEARVRAELAERAGPVQLVRDEFIGPSLGEELRRKAILALGIALTAQLAYLAVRFSATFGAAAVLAMAHDVVILVGLFAWLGKPLDGVFLAALLTVIGYSVNDSVVVFDRIRELLRSRRREPFAATANLACLQTVPRTVNTGLGAVLILGALLLFGGQSLTDFALALLVGIGIGTWSSMFTATPLVIALQRFQSPARTPPSRVTPRPVDTESARPRPLSPSTRRRHDSGAPL